MLQCPFFCQLNVFPKTCLPDIQSLYKLAYMKLIWCVITYYKAIWESRLIWMLWCFQLQLQPNFPFFQHTSLPKSSLPHIQFLYKLAYMLPITSVISCYEAISECGPVWKLQCIFSNLIFFQKFVRDKKKYFRKIFFRSEMS